MTILFDNLETNFWGAAVAVPAHEEQIKLARKAQSGNQNALETMVRANQGLVVAQARRFAGEVLKTDDLVQIGGIALVDAIKGYDCEGKNRFSTYAVTAIRNAMTRALQKKTIPQDSLESAADPQDKKIESPDAAILQKEFLQILSQAIESLKDERQRVVLCLRYGLHGGEEHTLADIGVILDNVTRGRVLQIEKEALMKIRDGKLGAALQNFLPN